MFTANFEMSEIKKNAWVNMCMWVFDSAGFGLCKTNPERKWN